MISYPCIGRSSSRCRTRPLKSPFPKKWKNPPNFSGALMTRAPAAGTRGSRGRCPRSRTPRRRGGRSRGPGSGDDEGRDRRGAVVQRQDRGADDQAGNDLAEDQDLAPHRVREEKVPGPLLVLRHERVRREQDSAEDDQEPREGRERRDESVRSGGVLDAEGGRQPDEQADDEPEEDQHPQEAAAADVLANLVGGD